MSIESRLTALRSLMEEKGIDACLVPTDDFHGSEYVGDYFKCRSYITGFTGSAGTALIMKDSAALWTDGRYFLQAARQLEGSGITLMRMGTEGVPTVLAYLKDTLSEGACLAFDGRTVSAGEGTQIADALKDRQIRILWQEDLVGQVWTDRPSLSCKKAWELDESYAGMTRGEKLALVRSAMEKAHADMHVLTSLDDIAWLLNIRGDDVACNPVVLSYLVVEKEGAVLYIQEEAVDEPLRTVLAADGVAIAPYNSFYTAMQAVPAGMRVLLSLSRINYALRQGFAEGVTLIDQENPSTLAKAVKNSTEMDNIRRAHITDGVAVSRFIYWLKHLSSDSGETELSAGEKLEALRREGKNYIGPSFEPIIAYGPHASVIHYSATQESNVPLERRAMILCDTGGQYLEGTTDITRTVVLGEITDEEKEMFTRVLKGALSLSAAVFMEGACGLNLDYLARAALWELGLDYRHGTGHGVGYCLNVHEGPNSFHWKKTPTRRGDTVLQAGMLTSNEPGYYKDNAYGIRHENLMLTHRAQKTDYGQFMSFEVVTLVPFDLDGIIPEMLTEKERSTLNAYHKKVYDTISPYLEGSEKTWLKEATRAI